jgi:hypothetical protein
MHYVYVCEFTYKYCHGYRNNVFRKNCNLLSVRREMLLVFYLNTLCINQVLVFLQEYSALFLRFHHIFLKSIVLVSTFCAI